MEHSLIDISIDETPPQVESPECSKLRERIDASRKLENERHRILEELLAENERLKEENGAVKAEFFECRNGHLEEILEENEKLKQKDLQLEQEVENNCGRLQKSLEENEKLKEEILSLKSELVSKSEQYQLASTQKLRLEALEQHWKETQASVEKAPFVLVLVDGNEHTFVDALYRKTTEGGTEAGLLLRDEIASRVCLQYECKIVTKLYVDFEGLLASGKLPRTWNISSLRRFFIGFTQVQAAFDVIDTGPGPQEATTKIKEMLDLFVHNVQCKHIFYACASDGKSLSTLDVYRDNYILRSSISLIQSKPYTDPDVYLPFEIIELPALFKTLKVGEEEEMAFDDEEVTDWKAFAQSHRRSKSNFVPSRSRPKLRSEPAPAVSGSTWAPQEKIVLLNINDQRVDSELGVPDRQTRESFAARMQKKKLCVYFHLAGNCFNNPCRFSHEPRLSSQELDVFLAVVRHSPCDYGSACRAKSCVYGHVCPKLYCSKGDECPFRHIHGVDKRAVRVWDPSSDGNSNSTSPILYNNPSPEQTYFVPETHEPEYIADIKPARPLASLFAPRNPNVSQEPASAYAFKPNPDFSESVKVEQGAQVDDEPYKRYFIRRSGA